MRSFAHAYTRRLRTRIVDLSHDNVIVIHGNSKITTMANDNGISKELLIFGKHEPLVTKLLTNIVTNGMTCLDIGSNIGYYAILEGKLVGPEGQVVAIEPSTRNFGYLKRNLLINRLASVKAYQFAVGDSDGTLSLESSRKSNLSRVVDAVTKNDVERVSSRRVDSFVSEANLTKIDFVRMDIEGFEYNAIIGAQRVLSKWKPEIIIEIHREILGKPKTLEMLMIFKSLGYEAQLLIPRDRDYPILSHRKYMIRASLEEIIQMFQTNSMPPKSKTFTLYLKPDVHAEKSKD